MCLLNLCKWVWNNSTRLPCVSSICFLMVILMVVGPPFSSTFSFSAVAHCVNVTLTISSKLEILTVLSLHSAHSPYIHILLEVSQDIICVNFSRSEVSESLKLCSFSARNPRFCTDRCCGQREWDAQPKMVEADKKGSTTFY